MASYRSHTTGFVNGTGGAGATLVLNQPAGLKVGDLMLGWIGGLNTNNQAPAPTTPTGWTLEGSVVVNSNITFYLFSKLADAADVAASTFSWSFLVQSGSTCIGGILYAIQNVNQTTPINTSNSVGGTASSTATSGAPVTPTGESVLFMLAGAIVTSSYSAQSIANHNPTWVEDVDYAQVLAASSITLAIARGSYPFTTTTGNASATLANASNNRALFLVAVNSAPAIIATPLSMTLGIPQVVMPIMAKILSMTLSIISPVVTAIAKKNINPPRHDTDWTNTPRND